MASENEIKTKIRQGCLETFDLCEEVFGPKEEPIPKTCYVKGIEAFSHAIQYGSICENMTMAHPFLLSAKANLGMAISENVYPSVLQKATEADIAYEKSDAAFCHIAACTLLNGQEIPSSFDVLYREVENLTAVLTKEAVAESSHKHLSASEKNDWSRYVARYIGLRVLCKTELGGIDGVIQRLIESSSFKGYQNIIDCLSCFLKNDKSNDECFVAYEKAYGQLVCLSNYDSGLVHGFRLPEALILSIIRFHGAFTTGFRKMFIDN